MRFFKIYLCVIIFMFLFVFLGGWNLFDFKTKPYLVMLVVSFIISIVISVFMEQEDKIDELEKRIKELEKIVE